VPLERRRARRTTLRGEVVALDAHRERVSAVLTGRDLSTLGMRVEPHPELVVGRRLVVAFYDCVSRGTVEMLGEVVRDGGAHGLGIRFVEMDAGTAARLEQLVATLPQVESLVPHTRPLVVARIRADEDAGEDAAARGGASGHQARDAGATEVEGARVEATEDEATGQEASVDEASGIDTPEIEATREGAEADPDLEQCAAPDTEAAHCAGEASGHGEASEHGQGRGSKRRRGRKRSRRRRGR